MVAQMDAKTVADLVAQLVPKTAAKWGMLKVSSLAVHLVHLMAG